MIFDDLEGFEDGEDDLIFGTPPAPSAMYQALDYAERPTRHDAAWWERSEAEYWLTSYPEFQSLMDRARFFIQAMGQAVMDATGASEDDPVLERADGSPVSMNELLDEITALELAALMRL